MYGGTKTEMERLLKDAEKLSGVNYDIDNLADVYQAIHVIQEDLGLTGNAAREASETFTGSFNAMKASATNLLADLTTGADPEQIAADVSGLISQAMAFVGNNVVPMAGSLIAQIPTLIETVAQSAVDILNQIGQNPSMLIDFAVTTLTNLANSLLVSLPILHEAMVKLVVEMAKAIVAYDWIGAAKGLIKALANGILIAVPLILKGITLVLKDMHDTFKGSNWKETGVNIIKGILSGLKSAAGAILQFMKELANSCLNAIKEALGIHSPSRKFRDEVGRWIPEGIGVGIKMYRDTALEPMEELSDSLVVDFGKFKFKPREDEEKDKSLNYHQVVNIHTTDNSPDEIARKTKLETLYGLMIDEPTFEPA